MQLAQKAMFSITSPTPAGWHYQVSRKMAQQNIQTRRYGFGLALRQPKIGVTWQSQSLARLIVAQCIAMPYRSREGI
jgi:hypothetical protein